jgi:hypothetical protein
MIRGTTVTVTLRADSEPDRLGITEPAYADPVNVANVVIAPGDTEDMDVRHPDGVEVAYTLHFPKTFDADLRGALVTFWGETFRVVGAPSHYMRENVRGPWYMPVGVERFDG